MMYIFQKSVSLCLLKFSQIFAIHRFYWPLSLFAPAHVPGVKINGLTQPLGLSNYVPLFYGLRHSLFHSVDRTGFTIHSFVLKEALFFYWIHKSLIRGPRKLNFDEKY